MTLRLRLWPFLLAAITLGACAAPTQAAPTPSPMPPTVAVKELPTSTAAIPEELAYSTALVDLLSQGGTEVQMVGPSMLGGLFDKPRLAVWIQTDRGIVEAVFLDSIEEASVISIVPFEGSTDEHYLYQVQALPPLLADELVIDSAFPLYYLIHEEMLIQTASEELYDILVEALEEDSDE